MMRLLVKPHCTDLYGGPNLKLWPRETWITIGLSGGIVRDKFRFGDVEMCLINRFILNFGWSQNSKSGGEIHFT